MTSFFLGWDKEILRKNVIYECACYFFFSFFFFLFCSWRSFQQQVWSFPFDTGNCFFPMLDFCTNSRLFSFKVRYFTRPWNSRSPGIQNLRAFVLKLLRNFMYILCVSPNLSLYKIYWKGFSYLPLQWCNSNCIYVFPALFNIFLPVI